VLLSITQYEGQPTGAALYGNQTIAADLSHYRAEIEALLAAPPPLPAGRAPAASSRADHGPAGTPANSPTR
jgi:hypothetical protein